MMLKGHQIDAIFVMQCGKNKWMIHIISELCWIYQVYYITWQKWMNILSTQLMIEEKKWKSISNTFEDFYWINRQISIYNCDVNIFLVNQLNLRKIKFIYFCNSISGVYISLLTIILNSHVNFLFYYIWGNSKCSSHNSRAPCTQRFLIFTWAYQLR